MSFTSGEVRLSGLHLLQPANSDVNIFYIQDANELESQ